MFKEIDYILEGKNAERFASLYACDPGMFACTYNKCMDNFLRSLLPYWSSVSYVNRKLIL